MSTLNHPPLQIAYLGETGFPYGLASIQRQLLISKGLVLAGAEVLVVSNKGVLDRNQAIQLPAKGKYQGVHYLYTSGEVHRREHFIVRNLYKVKGLLNEFLVIKELSKNRKLDFAIVATMRFQQQLYYYALSRLFGFKILLNLVERNSSIPTRTSLRDRINDLLIDRWSIKLADGILPISKYLEELVESTSPGKPSLKIPILSDPDQREVQSSTKSIPKYFLYCGSATYIELIDFIIQAFEKLAIQDVYLHLVVSGDHSEMEQFKSHLKRSAKRDKIQFFTRLSYPELLEQYDHALGLLIPLRPSIQDQARFPHKIGEYLTSGNPVITTGFGEISQYFQDRKDALISDEYDPDHFADKMRFVISNPEEAKRIGRAGKILAERQFNFRTHGQNLLAFMKSLSN